METTIKKNQTANIPTKNGSKYSYQYVDIAQIHEYLEENKMSYYQYIERIDGDDYIMTVPVINGEEKQARRGSRVVQATLMGNNNPAQEQGSALTYARRYSLLMAFGLATEDDDANCMSREKKPEEIEMTYDEAEAYPITFGKHKGTTLGKLNESDPDYIDWIVNNTQDAKMLKAIQLLTGQIKLTEEEQEIKTQKILKIMSYETKGQDIAKILEAYKVDGISHMTIPQMEECIETLKKKYGE